MNVHSYIRALPDEFLLKSVVLKFISKEISRAEHEYMNIHAPPPPPPINALVTPLFIEGIWNENYVIPNTLY